MAGPVLSASSPAITTITKNVLTMPSAAFSPPANSLIVVFWGLQALDSTALQSVTSMSSTGSAITWTNKARANHSGTAPGGSCEIWWGFNPAAQAGITVTGNFARSTGGPGDLNGGLLAIKIFTSAASTLAGYGSNTAVGTASSTPTASVTTIGQNSWVWGVVLNWATTALGTAGANQTVVDTLTDTNSGDAEWTQKQNAITVNPSVVAINDTNAIGSWLEAVVEIPQGPYPRIPPVYTNQAVQRAVTY